MRVAGIVVYNPDVERLKENIKAVYDQVDVLVIYKNSDFDTGILEEYERIVLLNDGKNNGIGTALNGIMAYADKQAAGWCLLLDQDSVVTEDYLEKMEKYCDLKNAGVITPHVIDEYDKEGDSYESKEEVETVDMCITSGSYNNIRIWKETGGFREEFFIDYIDWEYCARIRKEGFHVYRINQLGLYHELGKRTYHKLLGVTIYTFNHDAFRKYFITRNTIVTYKLYPYEKALAHPYLRALKRWIISMLFEEKKLEKTKAITKGIIDSRILYQTIRGKS